MNPEAITGHFSDILFMLFTSVKKDAYNTLNVHSGNHPYKAFLNKNVTIWKILEMNDPRDSS